jgi:transposase
MERIPGAAYTKELREEAEKLETEGGLSIRRWGVDYRLLFQRSGIGSRLAGKASFKRSARQQRPLTEAEMELARVKQELAWVKMERDVLKKATAYFAKESLLGTCSCDGMQLRYSIPQMCRVLGV